MRSQLRKDLHNHADDQLYKWVTDTFDTYHRVDIDTRDAAADVIFSLMTGIGALAAAFNLPPEAILDYFKKHLISTKRRYDLHTEKESH